jgi:hypothetical protein
VQTSVARVLGLNAALFLQQLNFRLRTPSHVVDGVAWYEASYATLQAVDFPFWSTKTIARTGRRLEKRGILIARPLSRNTYDRTKWYTINDEKLQEALGSTTGHSVPLEGTDSPHHEEDTVSPSLEEEKREKKEPEGVSTGAGEEDEESLPAASPSPAAAPTPGTPTAPPVAPALATPQRAPAPGQGRPRQDAPAVRHTLDCSMEALQAALAAWPQDAQALSDLHAVQATNPDRYHRIEQAAWEICLQRANGKRAYVFHYDLAFTMLDLLAAEDTPAEAA